MQSLLQTVFTAGNLTQLYNMWSGGKADAASFAMIKGVDDPFMREKYVLRVYCLMPLYAFRHWEERGLYKAFLQWLKEHPG